MGSIRLAWECAAACDGLAKALLRDSEYVLEWVSLCAQVCQAFVRACEVLTDETVQLCVESCCHASRHVLG